ncbi:hypothetical protein [Niabella ginsengisoli]|uniref:Twin-arginine translocation signal domain-containing protein n=1 Tax=Niabella ginsengisoli TaxID=522298 RepID=A0ABS9SEU4_9BACT|nr:hypothetical protein [Niabella ginsengisoli]MCH5596881.1 hypothetical protein [Niabella ginsengisoli]
MSIKRRDFLGNVSKAGLLGALGIGNGIKLIDNVNDVAARPEEGHIFLSQLTCKPLQQTA